MSRTVLVRLAIALACAGLFVAAVLSASHALNLSIPCGLNQAGCDKVARGSASQWFGVPIAYFGVLMYATLLALGGILAFGRPQMARIAQTLGLLVAAGGAITSILLQVYSVAVIHELCLWCVGSALIVCALLLTYAVLVQRKEGLPAVAVHPGRRGDVVLMSVLGAGVLLGFWLTMRDLGAIQIVKVDFGRLENPIEQIMPKDGRYNPNSPAPITIVEFGDLNCNLCQKLHFTLKERIKLAGGKMRMLYRHFPLYQTHPFSLQGAIIAEYAAEHGKFWEFIDAVYNVGHQAIRSEQDYFDIAGNLGLDVEAARKAVVDETSGPFGRVYRDLKLANTLGLQATPTYFVFAEGQAPFAVMGESILEILDDPRYVKIIQGDGN